MVAFAARTLLLLGALEVARGLHLAVHGPPLRLVGTDRNTSVVIRGSGFSQSHRVSVCGRPCNVTSSHEGELVCSMSEEAEQEEGSVSAGVSEAAMEFVHTGTILSVSTHSTLHFSAGAKLGIRHALWSPQVAYLRFSDLAVPRDATIRSVKLTLTKPPLSPSQTASCSPGSKLRIWMHDEDDTDPFQPALRHSLGQRDRVRGHVDWEIKSEDLDVSSPNLGRLLSRVVSRRGWVPGASVTIAIQQVYDSGGLELGSKGCMFQAGGGGIEVSYRKGGEGVFGSNVTACDVEVTAVGGSDEEPQCSTASRVPVLQASSPSLPRAGAMTLHRKPPFNMSWSDSFIECTAHGGRLCSARELAQSGAGSDGAASWPQDARGDRHGTVVAPLLRPAPVPQSGEGGYRGALGMEEEYRMFEFNVWGEWAEDGSVAVVEDHGRRWDGGGWLPCCGGGSGMLPHFAADGLLATRWEGRAVDGEGFVDMEHHSAAVASVVLHGAYEGAFLPPKGIRVHLSDDGATWWGGWEAVAESEGVFSLTVPSPRRTSRWARVTVASSSASATVVGIREVSLAGCKTSSPRRAVFPPPPEPFRPNFLPIPTTTPPPTATPMPSNPQPTPPPTPPQTTTPASSAHDSSTPPPSSTTTPAPPPAPSSTPPLETSHPSDSSLLATARPSSAAVTTSSRTFTSTPAPNLISSPSSTPGFIPEAHAEAIISSSGGTLSLPSAGVTLSEGAVVTSLTVTVLSYPPPQLSDLTGMAQALAPASCVVSFEPVGFQFESPVTLRIHTNDTSARRDLAEDSTLAIYSQDFDAGWEEVAGSVYDAVTGSVSVQTNFFQRRYAVFRMSRASPATTPSPQIDNRTSGETDDSPTTADAAKIDAGNPSVHQRISQGLTSDASSLQAVLDSGDGGLSAWIFVVAAVAGGACLCGVLAGAYGRGKRASRGLNAGGDRVAGYDAQVAYPCSGVSIVAEYGFDYAGHVPSPPGASRPGVVHGWVIPAAYPSFEVLAKAEPPQDFVNLGGVSRGPPRAPCAGGRVTVEGGEWGMVSAAICFDDDGEEKCKL